MSAGSYDILLEQGANYDQTFTWSVDGSPVNLTGYSARMQIRPAVTSSTVTFDFTSATTPIALGGAAGTIRLRMSATETASVTAGAYVYDLELVSGSGIVTRLLQGAVSVSPEVTR